MNPDSDARDLKGRLAALNDAQRALLARRLQEKASGEQRAAKRTSEAATAIPRAVPERVEVTPEGFEVSIYPASSDQERMWFLEQLTGGLPLYSTPRAFRLHGALRLDLLELALQRVVERHDSLRTTFASEEGGLTQRVSPPSIACNFKLECMPPAEASLAEAQRRELAERWIEAAAARSFNLTAGARSCPSLLRASVASLSTTEHYLLLASHHIVSDGWSGANLCRDLSVAYAALLQGSPDALPALPVQLADYTALQTEHARSGTLAAATEYWQRQLKGLGEPLDLGGDHPRPAVKSYRGETCALPLDHALMDRLKSLANAHGSTLFMVLLAAYDVLLWRYSGQTDLTVGVPAANRPLPEVEGLIGYLANTLVLRTDVSGAPSFVDLLGRVKPTALEAYEHQAMPFDLLVRLCDPVRDPSRTPLFQASFALQENSSLALTLPGVDACEYAVPTHTAKFDLALSMRPHRDGFAAQLEFSTDLFSPQHGTRILEHWQELLRSIAADPHQSIATLNLLPAHERQLVVTEWNRTATAYPRDACVHELFTEQAAKAPGAVAVVAGGETLTYGELDRLTDRLSLQLKACGAGPGKLVGLSIPRSFNAVIALLGVLKSGAAYWPLEENIPEERLRGMLDDAAPLAILVPRGSETPAALNGQTVLAVEDLLESPTPREFVETRSVVATDAAYVNYTSGSTGVPKAVLVPHRGVVRLVRNNAAVPLGSGDTLLQISPLSFDAATFELWGALLNGGRVVLFPPGPLSLFDIGETIRAHKVTSTFLTTGLFHALVDERLDDLRPLRQLITGGDILSPTHACRAFEALPGCRIINAYGPTENTTFTTCYPFTGTEDLTPSVPIGRPIANTQVYLLDAVLQPVPIGVAGELYTGGDGVAIGYLNQPELTEERFIADPFIADPFIAHPGAKLYRTGDRARWREDGNLEFLERSDAQVKIRGFRVELYEIEATLRSQPEVRDVAVVTWSPTAGQKELVAYLVASGHDRPESKTLRARVASSLPAYMAPRYFVWVESLPLKLNGKLDRNALPAPRPEQSIPEESVARPVTPLERELTLIWRQLFEVEGIARDDNFFAIGGHSLLATRLIAEIDRRLKIRLPIAALFQSPTIEQLAQRLGSERWRAEPRHIVPLHAAGTRPPLFCVHGLKGDLYVFRNISGLLGEDQPIFGLQGVDPDGSLPASIEDAVARYIPEMLSFQPEGPFFLLGFSLGGVYAIEVARQLEAAGREVGMLGLFDTRPVGSKFWALYTRIAMMDPPSRAMIHLRRLSHLPWSKRVAYVRARAPRVTTAVLRRLSRAHGAEAAPLDPAKDIQELLTDFYRVLALPYKPRPLSCTLDMFVAEDSFGRWPGYWNRLARKGVRYHPVSGRHADILDSQHLPSVAQTLRAALAERQNGR
ncbi:amino acid adenylation domain-containing protein [Bryocella elongata]|uniref:Amino acid adenylation domain-containing protein n=1 Tax=Bryocella elongata TaxID=863522 RepID=A0A1H5XW35_9BACT|nr:non-ribosomal peptide synthetase [Bryocella elongata]SEG15600.1 amino acid adenylation domain-containing protein [Bryocella elongata]